MQVALVLEPRLARATRRSTIAAGDLRYEAAAGFNEDWRHAARSVGDGRAMAEAYARLAGPYFDGVTAIRSVAGSAGT